MNEDRVAVLFAFMLRLLPWAGFSVIAALLLARGLRPLKGRRKLFLLFAAIPFIIGLATYVVGYRQKAPFFEAINRGDLSAIKSFLAEHPEWLEVPEPAIEEDTPLGHAVRRRKKEVVEFLIEKGANVNPEMGPTPPLLYAADSGWTDIADLLIRNGADINVKGFHGGYTALQLAATSGHMDIVKLLIIEHGAPVNARSTTEWTALMCASEFGQADVVRELLKHKADVNAASGLGDTALFLAVKIGHTEVVKILLEKGANVNDARLLQYATERRHKKIRPMLKKAGAKE